MLTLLRVGNFYVLIVANKNVFYLSLENMIFLREIKNFFDERLLRELLLCGKKVMFRSS